MAAAPDDSRTTLAELEAKLLHLERELLQGRHDVVAPSPRLELPQILGFEAATRPPLPSGQAALFEGPALSEGPALDADALREARLLLDALRETLDGVADAARRIGAHARALADDHDGARARMERTAAAAARAEEAAGEARRLASEGAPTAESVEAPPAPEPASREGVSPEAPEPVQPVRPRTRRVFPLALLLAVLILIATTLSAYLVVH